MMDLYESLAATVLVFWCIHRLLGYFIADRLAAPLGMAASILLIFALDDWFPVAMFMALFAPFGLMLPLLALQNVSRRFGLVVMRFTNWDLLLIIVLYIAFLAASIGVVAWDPYRFGYSPVGVGIVAFALCLFAVIRGHIVIAAAAILGQIMWFADIGSSNYFDHVSHVLLVPVIVTCMIRNYLFPVDNTI